jgi:hypothetical protein
VRAGADTQLSDWLFSDQVAWLGLIDQLVTGSAVVALLAREKIQRGRILAIILAVGLAATTLVGMATFTANVDQEGAAEMLAFCLALGLVVVFAGTRGWELLWLGLAALMGTLPLAIELLSAALSFTHQ